MRETMKDLIKSTITSIGIALTIFCVTGMHFSSGCAILNPNQLPLQAV